MKGGLIEQPGEAILARNYTALAATSAVAHSGTTL